jgi:hypothetical protein
VLFPDIFSIWAILGDSVFFLIGGGGQMAVAMVYTIVADVVPVEERTDMFFRLVALVLVFNVVFNPISAWLLQYDPWLSMWIGFGFMVFGTLCILLIPETMHLRRKGDMQHNEEHENEQFDDVSPSKHHVLKQAWFSIKNDMQHVWRFIFASKSIMILMFATAFFFPSRIVLSGIMLQYMSKRFEWSWSKVSHLLKFLSLQPTNFATGYIRLDHWHHCYSGVLPCDLARHVQFPQQVPPLQIAPHCTRPTPLSYCDNNHGSGMFVDGSCWNPLALRHFSHYCQSW